jgi:hypothetical protein
MMNELRYFTKLIEMSSRSPTDILDTKNDELNILRDFINKNKQDLSKEENISLGSKYDTNFNNPNKEMTDFEAGSKLSNIQKPEYELETSNPVEWNKRLEEKIYYNNTNNRKNQQPLKKGDINLLSLDKENSDDKNNNMDNNKFPSSDSRLDLLSTHLRENDIEKKQKKNNQQDLNSGYTSPIVRPSIPLQQEPKKNIGKEDLENKGFLQSLLDNSSINDNIKENLNSLIQSKFDHIAGRQDQSNDSHNSSEKTSNKNITNDTVSVSIGTIMIKVTPTDKENDRTPTQINSLKSDKQSMPSLRRYYVKLR